MEGKTNSKDTRH